MLTIQNSVLMFKCLLFSNEWHFYTGGQRTGILSYFYICCKNLRSYEQKLIKVLWNDISIPETSCISWSDDCMARNWQSPNLVDSVYATLRITYILSLVLSTLYR